MWRMSAGREFQTDEPATKNARSPNLVTVGGTVYDEPQLFHTNYTNFMMGKNFCNLIEFCKVMELYVSQNKLLIFGYKPTTALRQQFLAACMLLHSGITARNYSCGGIVGL